MWQTIVDRLSDVFSPASIGDWMARSVPDLVVALITFGAFWLLWRVLRASMKVTLARTNLDETARSFIETVVRYGVLTIGVVMALGQIGVNTTSVLASLGVVGLTLGFAAQDTLSNLISGIFIFWDRPFVIGDLVDIGGQYGRVSEITMRSTRVVTVDGRMLAIPNREIVNSIVASYTNFPNLRIDVPVTIGVGESVDRVRGLLLGIIEGDDRFMSTPRPVVVVTALNDYNVAVELRAWLEDERTHVSVRNELREKIFECLTAAGVDMPFERLDVRVTEA